MARFRARIVAPALLVPLLLNGCKDDGPTGPLRVPGILLAAGASATDTVDATPAQALVVEVRGKGGRLAPGTVVRFTSLLNPGDGQFGPVRATVSRIDAAFFNTFAVDTTDARGRASVLVRFRTTTGTARIQVTVPELGFTDTASYTVLPGAAFRVTALPKDTVLSAGGTATLRSTVTDRYGNPRNDPVTFARVSGDVTLQGSTVTAQGGGVAKIVAQAMGLSDTTTIAVVPSGVLAVSVAQSGVATVNLDGSGYRLLTTLRSAYVRWAPDGSAIAFDNDYAVPARIVTLDGAVRSVRQSSAGTEAEMYPVFSPDGAWVYLSVIAQGQFKLWRARPDGTQAALLTSASPEDDFYPSPSPDGTRLAYVRRTGGGEDYLRILDLNTGAVSKIDVQGHAPAWSPLGDLIAYVDLRDGSALKVMRPDGTGQRRVSLGGSYEKSVQWSPDGKWLVALNQQIGRIQLIDVATGFAVSLSYSGSMRSPAWKP